MPRRRSRRFCFTINNPTDTDFPEFVPPMRYLVFQLERSSNDTPHWQGYVEFSRPFDPTALRQYTFFERAAIFIANGTASDNRTYCTDPIKRYHPLDPPYEWGHAARPGVEDEYDELCEQLRDGVPLQTLYRRFTRIFIRHFRSINDLHSSLNQVRQSELSCPSIILFKWQRSVCDLVERTPDPRKVYWRFDTVGGTGKTTFIKYLCKQYETFIVTNSRSDRIIRAYANQPLVLFDITRSEGLEDQFNYSILETLKNGFGFNTMYEPCMRFWDIPHVFVFCNFYPNLDRLSADRWDILDISRFMY